MSLFENSHSHAEACEGRHPLPEIDAVMGVETDALLFRDARSVVDAASLAYYTDKVVLVTGGGGTIGSEICRRVAALSPRRLIIFDIYENSAYELQEELMAEYAGRLDLAVEIGSVQDRARLAAVFSHYRPEVVFHAAAHKHVPLMEHSASEAIKNNVFGTYNAADMAERYGASKFILISTDKAVSPASVMGATKRMCESVVHCRTDSQTVFSSVRFGNVLGSNGSVIPLFKRQIARGGPITLTDKRMTRYFMTAGEAASLVMQAGCMAEQGELFVLDMGEPVRILDLAEHMIRRSGLEPCRDIDIVEIGLRPGERLCEELLTRDESLVPTSNGMILVKRADPSSREAVEDGLDVLRRAILAAEDELCSPSLIDALKKVVPEFCPSAPSDEKSAKN